ncbi:MAG: patatin-like phospholipase family protein [Bacteroidetes bacterium]|nr:patatin-like phospholipase family protein [Bacteroidota bacterium]
MEKRIAFVISGAAAFIGQEVALCKALIEGLYPKGEKIKPIVLAGASSGSLSSVLVDGVLRNKANPQEGVSWDQIENDILFPLKNKNIFTKGILAGTADDVLTTVFKGYILNTKPLRKTLEKFVSGSSFMGYEKLGDVQSHLFLSSVSRETALPTRFDSQNPQHKELKMVDVLMASTAIPAAFPHQVIQGMPGHWTDGGFGTDSVPIAPLTQLPKFDEVYVITYDHRPKEINQKEDRFIGNLSFALKNMLSAAFPLQLMGALSLVNDESKAFVYMPVVSGNYSFLNFGEMQPQFEETSQWAAQNDPMPVKGYLEGLRSVRPV